MEITEEQVEKAVNEALDKLREKDWQLLYWDVNERSISHRLAIYLEDYFKNYDLDIDCEYNRMYDGKNIRTPKSLDIQPKSIISDDIKGTTVYPDIIVHRRNSYNNLVAIEIKKTSSNQQNYQYDLDKLAAFKNELKYKFAIFIKMKTGDDFCIEPIEWI
ncbi:MAG: hypothetical protein ACOZF2_03080 [Thermodesulfobacteriota bacterium]